MMEIPFGSAGFGPSLSCAAGGPMVRVPGESCLRWQCKKQNCSPHKDI